MARHGIAVSVGVMGVEMVVQAHAILRKEIILKN
jgi:hypothetical protein